MYTCKCFPGMRARRDDVNVVMATGCLAKNRSNFGLSHTSVNRVVLNLIPIECGVIYLNEIWKHSLYYNYL